MVNAKSETVNEDYLEYLDSCIGAEFVISGNSAISVLYRVNKQERDANNLPIGYTNSNPILNTCIYELEFPDGLIEEYSVNFIVDNCSTGSMPMNGTLAFLKKYKILKVTNRLMFLVSKALNKPWHAVKILWSQLKVCMSKFSVKYQSNNWIPLYEIKESNLIEVNESAI